MKFSGQFASLFLFLRSTMAMAGWKGPTLVLGEALQFGQDMWEANLATPNATGSVAVTGYDIAQTWPSQQVDGWTLAVNVSSDISESQTMKGGTGGKTFTGTSVFLRAPDGVRSGIISNPNAAQETTWKICMTFMTNAPGEESAVASNGGCTFLSTECIADLQDAYADKFAANQDCFASVTIPSSCGNNVNNGNLNTIQFPINYLNGTELLVKASEAHDKSDNGVWDTALKQAWPVLTVWGWNRRANASENIKPVAQLSCVRANRIQSGSGSPSSGSPSPGSSGSLSRGSAIIAFVITGIVALLLLGR